MKIKSSLIILFVLATGCKQREKSRLNQDVYAAFGNQMTPQERINQDSALLGRLQSARERVKQGLPKSETECSHFNGIDDQLMSEVLNLVSGEEFIDTQMRENQRGEEQLANSPRYRVKEELKMLSEDFKSTKAILEHLNPDGFWSALGESWSQDKLVLESMWKLVSFRALAHINYIDSVLAGQNIKPYTMRDILFADASKYFEPSGEIRKNLQLDGKQEIEAADINREIPGHWSKPAFGRGGFRISIGEVGVLSSPKSFLDSPHFGKWFTCENGAYANLMKKFVEGGGPKIETLSKSVTRSYFTGAKGVASYVTWTEEVEYQSYECGDALAKNLKSALQIANFLEANWLYIFYALDQYALVAEQKGWIRPSYAGTGWKCVTEVGQSKWFNRRVVLGYLDIEIINAKKRIADARTELTSPNRPTSQEKEAYIRSLKCPSVSGAPLREVYRGGFASDKFDWNSHQLHALKDGPRDDNGKKSYTYFIQLWRGDFQNDSAQKELQALIDPEKTREENLKEVFQRFTKSYQAYFSRNFSAKDGRIAVFSGKAQQSDSSGERYEGRLDVKPSELLLICELPQ